MSSRKDKKDPYIHVLIAVGRFAGTEFNGVSLYNPSLKMEFKLKEIYLMKTVF